MAPKLFPELPDATRAWVFALEGKPEDCRNVLGRVESFLNSWLSHGRAVAGQAVLTNRRLLIVCGHVPQGQVSGCSIDTLTRAVSKATREAGCHLVSPMKVSYQRPDGGVAYASRPAFRQLLRAGQVTPSTPVFDMAISELRGIRAGKFMQPLSQSSLARVFRV